MSEHQNGAVWKFDQIIPSNPVTTKKVLDELLEHLRNNHWPGEKIFGIHLAFEEALVNAIKHGNRGDETKTIGVGIKLDKDELTLVITDEGQGFNPASVPDCTLPENLEVPSGRGTLLMRKFMNHVAYNERGNSVTMHQTRAEVLAAT